ncbi:MAG: hypothetical protein ABIH26_10480, partial [Candidatus Eisenbacteria bacterium]
MRDEASIERIVEKVLARLGTREAEGPNLDGRSCSACLSPGRCASICPETTATIVREGADRVSSAPVGAGGVPKDVAGLIDHTILRANATRAEIEALLEEAKRFRFASVCVNPCWVRLCRDALEGSGVLVCTVAGFPLGASAALTKAFETRRACLDGAEEIDMVINVPLGIPVLEDKIVQRATV